MEGPGGGKGGESCFRFCDSRNYIELCPGHFPRQSANEAAIRQRYCSRCSRRFEPTALSGRGRKLEEDTAPPREFRPPHAILI